MMAPVSIGSRYTLKDDPYSSHSVILDWLGDGRGRRLLDVGAADGLLSRLLSERGWKVTGLEADPAAAAAGAAHCERMIVADLDAGIPPLEGQFDAIVCADVLEHLRDPAGALATLRRALARDGQVVISMPNVAHLWMRLSLLAGRLEYAECGILDRPSPAPSACAACRSAGACGRGCRARRTRSGRQRSGEHTSELQSPM